MKEKRIKWAVACFNILYGLTIIAFALEPTGKKGLSLAEVSVVLDHLFSVLVFSFIHTWGLVFGILSVIELVFVAKKAVDDLENGIKAILFSTLTMSLILTLLTTLGYYRVVV